MRRHPNPSVSLLITILAFLMVAAGYRLAVPGYSRPKAPQPCQPKGKLSRPEFESVMSTIAAGWNQGNARIAASCFADDAVYSAPPAQGHTGRKALYEYFGGDRGRPQPMHMSWHHLVFDPDQQIGVGEYTFHYQIQTHGLVIVRLSHGLIQNWREYEQESSLPWKQFVGGNDF